MGIESFEDVLSQFVYVDKTLAVCDLIDRRGVTLYCRPRRFGKSILLRMFQCFFELPVEGLAPDQRSLFSDLAIADEDRRYLNECGKHPVIYLNLASCGASSYDAFLERVASRVAAEFSRRRYLSDPRRMWPEEMDRFRRLGTATARPEELISSLAWLSQLLYQFHGSKVVVLIDEYDTPFNDAHVNGLRSQVLEFYRAWLSDALKGTTNLYCAALTGVLRVSQESMFSELNNVRIDTTLDVDHAEAIGFTEAEAEALAAYVGRKDKIDEMRVWYDGYRFGQTQVYSPWSVLNYLETGVAQPYWTITSRNGIVTELVGRAGEDQTLELTPLSTGGSVAKPLDLRTVFDDLATNREAVWPQLYQAGYVTTEDTGRPNDSRKLRALKVPNLEVRELFGEELIDRAARVTGGQDRLATLNRALLACDSASFAQALRRVLLDNPSYHDLLDEGDYYVLVLALLYAVPGYRPATSRRECGDGRCDVLLEPLPERAADLPAFAMELKVAHKADDEALAARARDDALDQAVRLEYGHGLAGARLIRWGVSFSGKRVAVAV